MGLTFTGTNERKLTKQKSFSFLLENCSVNNLTGSADFGFKDSSNQIKFTFDDGNIYDFDGRNCFSYIEDEKFTISGDFSDTKYTYKINDNLIAQGKSKTSFNIENFFLNTTGCTVSVDNLKINSDGLNYSITAPSSVEKTTTFNVTTSITSSNADERFYIFAVSLEGNSSSNFTLGSFTNEITNSTSGTIAVTHTGTVAGTKILNLKLHTNLGEITKQFSIYFAEPNTTSATNTLSLVAELSQSSDSSTWKEYIYQFTSSVIEYNNTTFTSSAINQTCHVSLEYVSGNIGAYYTVNGVNITDGGSGYTEPTVAFGAATSPDVTATGTATQDSGAIDSVTITNSGNYYAAVPTVTFSDPDSGASGAAGVATTDTYDKTFTNTFDIGTSFVRDSIITDFLARGLTEAQGDASYNSTYGQGKYKTTSTISVAQNSVLYIKIVALDHPDNQPISAKLKVESTYADTNTSRTTETATINITS